MRTIRRSIAGKEKGGGGDEGVEEGGWGPVNFNYRPVSHKNLFPSKKYVCEFPPCSRTFRSKLEIPARDDKYSEVLCFVLFTVDLYLPNSCPIELRMRVPGGLAQQDITLVTGNLSRPTSGCNLF